MAERSTQMASRTDLSDDNAQVQVILTPTEKRRHRNRKFVLLATLLILSFVIGCVYFAYKAFGASAYDEGAIISTRITYKDPAVQQVVVLFRHGERTPTETYALDPNKDYVWEGGMGVLRKSGMKRMYKLGQWLRSRYGWLNEGRYNNTNTYAQSSYADRCIESTQALLAGLYPVEAKDAFTPNLLWRPIPVHSTPRNLDKVITVKHPCPRIDELLQEAYNQSIQDNPELKEYLKKLSEIAGQEMKTITDVEFLYNTLEIQVKEGLSLDPKMKEMFDDPQMLQYARQSYAIFTKTKEQKKLTGGNLLISILTNMQNFEQRQNAVKIHLYGVHDITLVNLLRTMGIERYEGKLLKPDLGATLIFELRKNSHKDETTVQLYYMDNSSSEELYQLYFPYCFWESCEGRLEGLTVANIRSNFDQYIPKNWTEECKKKN